MFLIKSADTALQDVSLVFYPTAIGSRIFHAGPLNLGPTPFISIISHILSYMQLDIFPLSWGWALYIHNISDSLTAASL